jgi:hypothetical protein
MAKLTRLMHDDLTPESRRYLRALERKNRTKGVVPMEVWAFNMVEHGLFEAKVTDGKPGTHPDDYSLRKTPLCTKEAFDALAYYMEDANS